MVRDLGFSLSAVTAGVLVFVLLTAATAKSRDLKDFGSSLAELGIPSSLVRFVGIAVISIEAFLGFGVGLGIAPVWAAACAMILFLVFAAVGVVAESRGLAVSCSCFGSSHLQLGRLTALRSSLLAAVAGIYGIAAFWGQVASPSIVLALATTLGVVSWWVSFKHVGKVAGYRY